MLLLLLLLLPLPPPPSLPKVVFPLLVCISPARLFPWWWW